LDGELKSAVMVLAYHIIFTAYGFWLPNDPRGSWSEWVASWELLKFGRATTIYTRSSVAHAEHDWQWRRAAKAALKHAPVKFTGVQALSISKGFAKACRDSGYVLRALSILEDHVHGVLDRHERAAEQVVGHLKSAASRQLRIDGLHPFDDGGERIPSVWAEGCWKRFLNSGDEIIHAVDYTDENPIKEGKRRQHWSLVTPFVGG
jgi:REP element-mobilizing transposase RayT